MTPNSNVVQQQTQSDEELQVKKIYLILHIYKRNTFANLIKQTKTKKKKFKKKRFVLFNQKPSKRKKILLNSK